MPEYVLLIKLTDHGAESSVVGLPQAHREDGEDGRRALPGDDAGGPHAGRLRHGRHGQDPGDEELAWFAGHIAAEGQMRVKTLKGFTPEEWAAIQSEAEPQGPTARAVRPLDADARALHDMQNSSSACPSGRSRGLPGHQPADVQAGQPGHPVRGALRQRRLRRRPLRSGVLDRLAERMPEVALPGEWVFARCLFGDDEARDEAYLQGVASGFTAEDRDVILRARAAAPAFLERLIAATRWGDFDVVGFTSSCGQNSGPRWLSHGRSRNVTPP